MNTCARLESTGTVGKVHVSKTTADLLVLAGKGHWLKRREELVHLKGKGSMQTFFLAMEYSSEKGGSAQDNSIGYDEVAVFMSSSDDAMSRLIDWTVSTLSDLLKKVVSSRPFTKTKVSESSVDLLQNTAYSFLDEVAEIVPVGSARTEVDQTQNVDLPYFVHEQLHHFVTTIAGLYRDNAFHSFQHATHVL